MCKDEKLLLAKLVCPCCRRQSLIFSDNGLQCMTCNQLFAADNNLTDLSVRQKKSELNISQAFMEWPPLALIYEKFWRPLVTLPFSEYRWEKEKVINMLELEGTLSILDIACGPGNFTKLIARNCSENSIILGIDLSEPMLRKAVKMKGSGYENIRYFKADVSEFPFADNSFDRIHCSGALHLFPDPQKVFYSIAGSLRPGGIFAGSTYVKNTSGGGKIKDMLEPLLKFHWFTTDELKEYAANAGLVHWEHQVKKQGVVFKVKKNFVS